MIPSFQLESYASQKKSHLHINFQYKYPDYKKYCQDTDLVIIQVNTEVPHIPYVIVYPKDIVYSSKRYSISKEIPIAFHYD